MVSFWPFKGDDTSAASFEKALSQLSTKIAKATAQTEGFRQKQRRYKVLWTLYSTFAYILVALILTLITGWETWGAVEYSAVAGGPLLIYAVRTSLDAYYNYRLTNSQNYLNELVKQREAKIEKLKDATKYNSTQQLLDKYGGTPKPQKTQQPKSRKPPGGDQNRPNMPQGQRTGFAPPPTANIARPGGTAMPPPLEMQGPGPQTIVGPPPVALPSRQQPEITEEFAPNAFSAYEQSSPAIRSNSTQYMPEGPKWYDRIMDVILGDDETQAKNRLVLICQSCKLVNGQAPPGTKTLEEVGRWRCSSCQAWNGIESEEKTILRQVANSADGPRSKSDDSDYDKIENEVVEDDSELIEATEASPAASTRSKARQRKKE
ncbi:Hypothetical protein R9X50_00593600 [Acrodontium crateriforme]|uniref:Endoplasmic reticulum junction formation protein lunapark n=1 Tax=Acrodontium crateriforme TaxID=150365 RepID=A0AAQ3MCZ2_9PEZI|nr:Hypothetical protein R9X50_00593600 [Acrodontium crateriforme]